MKRRDFRFLSGVVLILIGLMMLILRFVSRD